MAMFWKMWTHDQNSSPSSTRTSLLIELDVGMLLLVCTSPPPQ